VQVYSVSKPVQQTVAMSSTESDDFKPPPPGSVAKQEAQTATTDTANPKPDDAVTTTAEAVPRTTGSSDPFLPVARYGIDDRPAFRTGVPPPWKTHHHDSGDDDNAASRMAASRDARLFMVEEVEAPGASALTAVDQEVHQHQKENGGHGAGGGDSVPTTTTTTVSARNDTPGEMRSHQQPMLGYDEQHEDGEVPEDGEMPQDENVHMKQENLQLQQKQEEGEIPEEGDISPQRQQQEWKQPSKSNDWQKSLVASEPNSAFPSKEKEPLGDPMPVEEAVSNEPHQQHAHPSFQEASANKNEIPHANDSNAMKQEASNEMMQAEITAVVAMQELEHADERTRAEGIKEEQEGTTEGLDTDAAEKMDLSDAVEQRSIALEEANKERAVKVAEKGQITEGENRETVEAAEQGEIAEEGNNLQEAEGADVKAEEGKTDATHTAPTKSEASEPPDPSEMDIDTAADSTTAAVPQTEAQAPQKSEQQQQQQVETGSAKDAIYSTRGRTSADLQEVLERLEAEPAREKETTPRETFLNDSITEEERRTRTRYIPQVEGMHALRKPEIKSDLALARTNFANVGMAGTVATAKAKAKKAGGTTDMMDVDDVASNVDDDRASEILRVGTRTLEIGANDLVVPSTAFVAPPPVDAGKATKTPREVESVAAFNPPRPPESIGAKKKHRMLRWERRPADIEVDLSNYRKTVQRTRQELKSAEAERDRLEAVEFHMRRHFFRHLQCMNEEWKRLNDELAAVQQECVNAADLLTSRTRSRGASKSSYAMRDVLSVLRARGQEIEAKGLSSGKSSYLSPETQKSGAGGIGAVSFVDWDRSTEIKPGELASAWIVPGDEVKTPYGDGTVVSILGPYLLDTSSPLPKEIKFGRGDGKRTTEAMDIDGDDNIKHPKGDNENYIANDERVGEKSKKSPKETAGTQSSDGSIFVLPARAAVRLPFGIGFFNIGSVLSKEDPSTYSDARLALRWKGIAETAAAMGSFVDVEAMAKRAEVLANPDVMDLDETPILESNDRKRPRQLPFGAGMFPTGTARGAMLASLSLDQLDREMETAFQGHGVLGSKDNRAVTKEIRKNEDKAEERLKLKAKALQLRNELYRQRRVRLLNERTYIGSQERALRVEQLVAEMRTDLKTLKLRLDQEIKELGMSEKQAENILSSYYKSLDSRHQGDATPPKRQRRESRAEEEDEDMDVESSMHASSKDLNLTGH